MLFKKQSYLFKLVLIAGLLNLLVVMMIDFPLQAQENIRLNHAGFPAVDPPEQPADD